MTADVFRTSRSSGTRVYCKDVNRRGDFPNIHLDFLGFRFPEPCRTLSSHTAPDVRPLP
jgi:hypothetical protein